MPFLNPIDTERSVHKSEQPKTGCVTNRRVTVHGDLVLGFCQKSVQFHAFAIIKSFNKASASDAGSVWVKEQDFLALQVRAPSSCVSWETQPVLPLRSWLFRLAQLHHVGMPEFLPFVTKLFRVRHRRSRPLFGAEGTGERFQTSVQFCNFVNDDGILAVKFRLQAVLLLAVGSFLLPSHRAHEHRSFCRVRRCDREPRRGKAELPNLVGVIGSPRLADRQTTVALPAVKHVQMDPGVGHIRHLGKCSRQVWADWCKRR